MRVQAKQAIARACALLVAALVAAIITGSAQAASWKLVLPASINGVSSLYFGPPGDLECWSAIRCLMSVNPTLANPPGTSLQYFNGDTWKPIASVCGDDAAHSRIAWAGPSEWWLITVPSTPRSIGVGFADGQALCHFRNGEVVGSYSTPVESNDPYRELTAAACNGPSDCWFGGSGSQSPDGSRVGAFHLHWDGAQLTTYYGPSGRGVSDLKYFAGNWFETTLMGRKVGDALIAPDFARPELPPRLIHKLDRGDFVNEPFVPNAISTLDSPSQQDVATELLALDANATSLWAVGGGAASGAEPGYPKANPLLPFKRGPIVARSNGSGWNELPLTGAAFAPGSDRFVDVAAVPGQNFAWAAVQPFNRPTGDLGIPAVVAQIDSNGFVTKQEATQSAALLFGLSFGAAAKIECVAINDCWLATTKGSLFHYSDDQDYATDAEAAFQSLIDFRPNEAAAQSVADERPVDDSLTFAPAPSDDTAPAAPGGTKRLKSALRKVKGKLSKDLTLVIKFEVIRKVRVGLVAKRRKQTVACTRPKLMRPGHHKISIKLNRDRWPTKLAFSVKEKGSPTEVQDPNSVTVPDGGATAVTAMVNLSAAAAGVRCQ